MSIYSNLKIELMTTGENASTWGNVTNTNLGTAIEEAIVGSADVTFAGANPSPLTLSDTNGTQTARNMRLNLVGTTGGATRTLTVPSIEKLYVINNTCEDAVIVRTNPGSGVTVPAGKTMWVYSTGANVVDVVTHLTSLTLGSPLPVASGGTGSSTGNAGSLTGFNASNVTTGTLVVAYGGTGSGTASGARVNLLPSYTGNAGKLLALNSGGTDVEWVSAGGAGTVTSVNATTAISGLSFTGGPITSAGTLTLTGTLGVQGGGTGTTSLTSGAVLIGAGTSAVTSVSPGTSGNVLTSNGSAWVSQAGGGGAVSSVSGSGAGISVSPTTGSVIITNTGVTSVTAGSGITVNAATGSILISASGGGSGTVTSVNASTSLSGLSFSGGPITSSGTLSLSGTLGASSGGTGLTSPGTSGNVLTSNGSAWVSQAPSAGGGTVSLNDGSVSSPSLNFSSDTNTGIYRPGIDQIGFAAGGTRVGWLASGTTGIAFGQGALGSQTSGTSNVVIGTNGGGFPAGGSITSAGNSACLGNGAGYSISTGSANTAIGSNAMSDASNKVTGSANTGVGYQVYAGILSSGSFSGQNTTCLGWQASPSSTTVSNEITLGNASITTLRCQTTTITSLSDARDKKDIVTLDAGLDFINALNPVRFTWDMRPQPGPGGEAIQGRKGDPDTGFLAQDLKAVQEQLGVTIPGLVYETNPEKLEAGYGKLLPVLVKAIQELSAKVDALEAQLGG